MRLLRVVLGFVLVAGVGATAMAFRPMSADEAAIRATLQHYLDGHATGRGEIMAQAFDSVANLYWVRDGVLQSRTVEAYVGGFRGQPPADEAQRRRRIVSVDVAGTAAVAKIELDYPNALFNDYMSLLKINGEWLIVAKVFDSQPR